jgi:hypothetical protein
MADLDVQPLIPDIQQPTQTQSVGCGGATSKSGRNDFPAHSPGEAKQKGPPGFPDGPCVSGSNRGAQPLPEARYIE